MEIPWNKGSLRYGRYMRIFEEEATCKRPGLASLRAFGLGAFSGSNGYKAAAALFSTVSRRICSFVRGIKVHHEAQNVSNSFLRPFHLRIVFRLPFAALSGMLLPPNTGGNFDARNEESEKGALRTMGA